MSSLIPSSTGDRFAWLLSGPQPESPPAPGDLEAAVQIVRDAGPILAHTAPRLRAWAGPRHQDEPLLRELAREEIAARAVARLHAQYADAVLRALDAAGIRAVLLKGSALRLSVYPDPWTRSGDDLDVAVAPDDVATAEGVLVDLGFEPAEWWRDERQFRRANVIRRILAEADHHEAGMMVRWTLVPDLAPEVAAAVSALPRLGATWHPTPEGQVACYVTIDLHRGLSNSQSIEPVLASRRRITRDGLAVWAPTLGWSLFYAVIKVYWEAHQAYRKGLHLMLDILQILRAAQDPDLEEFMSLADAYGVQVPTYYVLRRIEASFGEPLAAALRAWLEPWATVRRRTSPVELRDLGDLWPRLWGYR